MECKDVLKLGHVIEGLRTEIGDSEGTGGVLQSALWWIQYFDGASGLRLPENDQQVPAGGFSMEELRRLEKKAIQMGDVTPNQAWKRTYYRLADVAVELMGRMYKTRVPSSVIHRF